MKALSMEDSDHCSRGCWKGIVLAAGIAVSGCTKSKIEFDRMTGTTYPVDRTVNGETVTLESVYADAGKVIVIDQDTTNIAPLTVTIPGGLVVPACITNAELDTVMAANRSSPTDKTTFSCLGFTCTDYHLYGLVAFQLGVDPATNTCDLGLMGIIWRTADRSGFAMFFLNSTVFGDPARYFRTVAHEIGHGFNLHHEDGDGSSTIMNQTTVVGSSFTYTFSIESEEHLDDHPDSCKYPGVGAYGVIDSAHTSHTGTVTGSC